ncbi:MAG: hypothetical protein II875_14445 [Clostridia bacterium]|nr:hypothetical protein [Clostridia bacterium]
MKYLRRAAVFIATRLVLITLILSLLVYAFYMAFNLSNAYIVVSEGLEKRVSVTLTRTDSAALNHYFTKSFIDTDPVLSASKHGTDTYRYFDINSFDYDVKISSLWWRPLKTVSVENPNTGERTTYRGVVTCTVTETVSNITGSLKREYASSGVGGLSHWGSGRYNLTLVSVDGDWLIVAMEQDSSYQDPDA